MEAMEPLVQQVQSVLQALLGAMEPLVRQVLLDLLVNWRYRFNRRRWDSRSKRADLPAVPMELTERPVQLELGPQVRPGLQVRLVRRDL